MNNGTTPNIYDYSTEGTLGYRYRRTGDTSTGATGNQDTTMIVDTDGTNQQGFNHNYESIFLAGSQNALQTAEGTGSNMGIMKLHFGYQDDAGNFSNQVVHNLNWDDTPPVFSQSGSISQDGTT